MIGKAGGGVLQQHNYGVYTTVPYPPSQDCLQEFSDLPIEITNKVHKAISTSIRERRIGSTWTPLSVQFTGRFWVRDLHESLDLLLHLDLWDSSLRKSQEAHLESDAAFL